MSEIKNLPPKRKRGYASIQECPPLDSLTSMEILSVKPKRERNVVARSSNNKARISYVSIRVDDLNEANTLTTYAGSTSSTTGSSNNIIQSNMSIPYRPIHVVSTADTNSFLNSHSDTSMNGMNNTENLRRAAASARTAAATISTAAATTSTAATTASTAATTISTVVATASTVNTQRPSVSPLQQSYTLTTSYPPTNPASIPVEVTAETTTAHRTTSGGTSTVSTYWAGVLYIDPVSELQVWKGTYVECIDTTTRPTPAAFSNNTNAFEYSTMQYPGSRPQYTHTSTTTTTGTTARTTMTTEYSTVVTPMSGTLVGNYLSSTTMTNTTSSFELIFQPIKEPGMVSMRYSALGSGIDTSGKFIVCGVYSSISGVLELRKLYLEN